MLSFINQLQDIVLNVLLKRRVVPLWIVALFALSGNSWAYDCSSQSHIPPSECMALLTLMDVLELVDASGKVLSMETELKWAVPNSNPCKWGGISCIDPSGTVFALDGNIEQIAIAGGGSTVTSFRLKTDITTGKPLNLPDFCTIPGNKSSLPKLYNLNLRNNDFSGTTIPNFCLPELQTLNLSNSKLSGSIPDFTKNSPKLYELKLNHNNLIGNIPPLPSSVTDVYLQNNMLSGVKPVGSYSIINTDSNCSLSLGTTLNPNGCNITINGLVFEGSGKYDSQIHEKVAGHNLYIGQGTGNTGTYIQTDKYGNFSHQFNATGEPIYITNMNDLGWDQTTYVSSPKSGLYSFNITNPTLKVDFSNIEIGILKNSSTDYINGGLKLTAQKSIANDSCSTIYEFTCTNNFSSDYNLKSCRIQFGDGTETTVVNENLDKDSVATKHFYSSQPATNIIATAVLMPKNPNSLLAISNVKEELIPSSVPISEKPFDCYCGTKAGAKYQVSAGSLVSSSGTKNVVFIDTKEKIGFDQLKNKIASNDIGDVGICINTDGKLYEGGAASKIEFGISYKPKFIYNQGTISHDQVTNAVYKANADKVTLSNGEAVSVYAAEFIVNSGVISAGKGSSIADHSNSVYKSTPKNDSGIDEPLLEASDGGNLTLDAQTVFNLSGGVIGSEGRVQYGKVDNTEHQLITYGGNGGVASRSATVRRYQDQTTDNECSKWFNLAGNPNDKDTYVPSPYLPTATSNYSFGDSQGGKGGDVTINVYSVFENYGTLRAGSGGDARAWECDYIYNGDLLGKNMAFAGEGGKTTININGSSGIFRGYGGIDGSGGRILLEPVVIQGSNSFRIVNASEAVIFGGDGAQIKLNNLAAGAISATGDIILAVGQGGIVDLRGNNAKIFNSTSGKVKIYADTVLLDTGVTLADLANVTVEKYPAQILFAVNLQGTGTIKGNANATLPLAVTVQNVGPSSDTYTLSLTNPNNWQITGLPSSLTVDGLKSQVITLQVTLPANAVGSLVNDIVIRAVSNANATATSEMKVRLIADAQISASACTATYDLNTRTVTIPKVDVPVLDVITGKPSTDIAVFSAKLQQHLGVDDFSIVDNSFQFLSLADSYLPENARYTYNQDLYTAGGVLDFCVQVPSVVVIPPGIPVKGASKNYRVKLRQLAIQPNTFHVETITPITQ